MFRSVEFDGGGWLWSPQGRSAIGIYTLALSAFCGAGTPHYTEADPTRMPRRIYHQRTLATKTKFMSEHITILVLNAQISSTDRHPPNLETYDNEQNDTQNEAVQMVEVNKIKTDDDDDEQNDTQKGAAQMVEDNEVKIDDNEQNDTQNGAVQTVEVNAVKINDIEQNDIQNGALQMVEVNKT